MLNEIRGPVAHVPSSVSAGTAALEAALDGEARLVVLDNVVHLADAVAFATSRAARTAAFLITTRSRNLHAALGGDGGALAAGAASPAVVDVGMDAPLTFEQCLSLLASASGESPAALPPAAHDIVRLAQVSNSEWERCLRLIPCTVVAYL